VVLCIVAILFTVLVPMAWKTIENGRAVTCTGNLRQISVGLTTYLGEHDMTMPVLKAGRLKLSEDVPVIDNTFDRYISDKRVFLCPSDAKIGKQSGTSYYWNVALNGQSLSSLDFLKLTEEHSKIPVLSDKESFHPYLENKVNILYADGHATKDLKFITDEPQPGSTP
jgi:prepilin-type processing-associated H-X9-DG protein